LRTYLFPAELGPDFRKIFPAAIISNLGDGALIAAGPLLVASITTEPAAVGAAAFVQQLPWLLFALFSGVLVDRLDRRMMIVAADTFRALVLGALGIAVLLDTAPLWAVYVALFLLGTAETLADNASGALLVSAVPKEHLGKANARLFASGTVLQQLGGPPLGALLFAAGAGIPLVFDAVTFAAAATLIVRVAVRPPLPDHSTRAAIWHEVREGVRWLWHHSGVRTLALSILVMNITFCAAFATWVLFARERLGLTETQFGRSARVGRRRGRSARYADVPLPGAARRLSDTPPRRTGHRDDGPPHFGAHQEPVGRRRDHGSVRRPRGGVGHRFDYNASARHAGRSYGQGEQRVPAGLSGRCGDRLRAGWRAGAAVRSGGAVRDRLRGDGGDDSGCLAPATECRGTTGVRS
jgi:hypothetical protein